jgi:hypothetical protein
MSEHTAPALAKVDALLPHLQALPAGALRDELIETMQALRSAVAAFHMEAIRFRMFTVDRLLAQAGARPDVRAAFDALRHELEAAGFHTRSHSAP